MSNRLNEVRWLADEAASDQPVQTDASGCFRIEGVFPDLKLGLNLSKGNNFFRTDKKYQGMMLKAETKDVSDIIAKVR